MRRLLGLGAIGLLLAGAGAAEAAFFNVTKTADAADGACDADCSLREAVVAANATAAEDTIYVPPGTYTLSIAGTQEDDAAAGDLDVTNPLRILGAGRAQTVLDANGVDRVLHFRSVNSKLELRHLTIRGGKTFPAEIASHGAGAYLQYVGGPKAPVYITDVLFEDNDANFLGGGLYVSAGVTVDADRCEFRSNSAQNGGGIYVGDAGDLRLRNSVVEDNTASADGGGLSLNGRGAIEVAASRVLGNHASGGGGGIYAGGLVGAGYSRVEDTTVSGNESTAGSGGGIYAYFGQPEFRRTLVSGNASMGPGAGIYAWLGGDATAVLENLTITGNTVTGAGGKGGGIHLYSLTHPGTLFRNLTIADNAAPGGGRQIGADSPVYAGNLALRNSIVAGAESCSLPVGTGGGNVDSAATCGLDDPSDKSNTNPSLGALADNGGLTRTRAVPFGGAAAGVGADCPDEDQRGFVRIHPDGCYAGAFEPLTLGGANGFSCGGGYEGLRTKLGYIVEDLISDAAANVGDILYCLGGIAGQA